MKIEINPYEPEGNDLYDGYDVLPTYIPTSSDHWTKCRFIQRFPLIETEEIKRIPGLEKFSFYIAFQQATNFAITFAEGTILAKYIERVRPNAGDEMLPDQASDEKNNPPQPPRKALVEVELLKCDDCGSYVFSTDVDRHIHLAHTGQLVKFMRTKN